MKADTKSKLRSQTWRLIASLKKHCTMQKLFLNGVELRVADVISEYEDQLRLLDEADAATAKWQCALKQTRAKNETMKPKLRHLQMFVANHFGLGSPIFLEFGFKPRKVTKKSAITKANAVVKQKATRKAHHPATATLLNGTTNGTSHP